MNRSISRLATVLTVSVGLASCQQFGLAPVRVSAQPDPVVAANYQATMTRVLASLSGGDSTGDPAKLEASLPNDYDPRWNTVTLNGFSFVNTVCRTYLNDLHRAERNYGAAQEGLSATQSATTAVLSATLGKGDVQKTVEILTALFGLSKGLLSTSEKSVLYELDAATVIDLWGKLAKSYAQGYEGLPIAEEETNEQLRKYATVNRKAYTRVEAIAHISEYLSLCLPSKLEGQVLAAVKAAKVEDTTQKQTAKQNPETKQDKPANTPSGETGNGGTLGGSGTHTTKPVAQIPPKRRPVMPDPAVVP